MDTRIPQLELLLRETLAYPGPTDSVHEPTVGPTVPLIIQTRLGRLSFVGATTVFGSAADVTLQEVNEWSSRRHQLARQRHNVDHAQQLADALRIGGRHHVSGDHGLECATQVGRRITLGSTRRDRVSAYLAASMQQTRWARKNPQVVNDLGVLD